MPHTGRLCLSDAKLFILMTSWPPVRESLSDPLCRVANMFDQGALAAVDLHADEAALIEQSPS